MSDDENTSEQQEQLESEHAEQSTEGPVEEPVEPIDVPPLEGAPFEVVTDESADSPVNEATETPAEAPNEAPPPGDIAPADTPELQVVKNTTEDEYPQDDAVLTDDKTNNTGVSPCTSSSDSDENVSKRPSQHYSEILLRIVTQNKIIGTLKDKIKHKCTKFPRSACEEREIFNFKVCLEQENLKLQTLVRCAINIQSKYPDRKWPPIPLETTWDEDRMATPIDYRAVTANYESVSEMCEKNAKGFDMPQFRLPPNQTYTSEYTSEDNCTKDLRIHPPKTKKRGVSKELTRSYNMQEKLVADNADLEGDRYKLQEELLSRDRMIECLQQKVCLMHAELTKICRQTHGLEKNEEKSICDELPKLQSRVKEQGSTTKCLSTAMDRIQNTLNCLKLEVDALKKCKERSQSRAGTPKHGLTRSDESDIGERKNEYQELKVRYYELLEDYTSKERELSALKDKINAFIEGKPMQEKDIDESHEAEVRLLRQKLKECREEQDEFKVIISEQAKQTDEYREKYMASLQKNEELKCILQKMEIDNRRIEDQINLEVQRIKSKFQEKLQDWAHLPKMLESEQAKLAQCCKEKEDLEVKLRIVCREVKILKSQRNGSNEDKDDPDKLRRLEQELSELKVQHEALLEMKNRIAEKYEQLKREMDCLRQESAKIICRLKERSTSTQSTLQKHIDELEHELAQCRATACLSIADREEVIKDMQSQLNCLGLSFDSAQKQIKSLKDHISHLSNEKAKSVICFQGDKA